MSDTDRILDKLTDQAVHLAKIDERLGHYNQSLDVHIKRTGILEKQMNTALLPIKALKLLVTMAAGAASIVGFLKMIGQI